MAVYHVVLFKLKPGITPEQVKGLNSAAEAMVGKIPGLVKLNAGTPLAITAARAKGYDLGLVAVLEKPEDLPVYALHPLHKEVLTLKDQICDDTLAFDMEF